MKPETDPPERIGLPRHPCLVRVQRNHLCTRERLTRGRNRHFTFNACYRRASRGYCQPQFCAIKQFVVRIAPCQISRLLIDNRNTFAALLQKVLPVTRTDDIPYCKHTEDGRERFVAGGLSITHGFDRQRVGQGTRRVQLKPIVEDKEPYLRILHRVIAVNHGVDNGLEHRPRTELRHLHTSGSLARRHPRVEPGKIDGVADLLVQWTSD